MRIDRSRARHARHAVRTARETGRAIAVLFLAGATLAGCTVVEGKSSEPEREAPRIAETQPAPNAAGDTATALAHQNIASAGIPIPLISPRHIESVRVASVDPRAGLNAFGGASIRQIAGVYLKYDDALTLAQNSKLKTPKEVRRVLKDLRFAEPIPMAQGWYAVHAMTAAQTAAFAQAIRDEERINGRDRVLRALESPNYVLRLPGADAASNAIIASVAAENRRMLSLRQHFLDTAQRFMRQKWGMSTPIAPVSTASAEPADAPSLASLLSALSPVGEAQAYSPAVMTKILSVAARQVLSAPAVEAAQRDETSTCLNWARLNLDQCIAAAHFPSEEAWCTGTHAIEEVRACWASVLPASATMTPAAH